MQPDLLHDEVLRKIGRNLLCYQRIEFLMKELLALSSIDGDHKTMGLVLEGRRKKVSGQTLGQLVDPYIGSIHAPESTVEVESKAAVSFRFRIETKEGEDVEIRNSLRELVANRNLLVHHMFSDYRENSRESCQSVISALDSQYSQVSPQYVFLRNMLSDLTESRNELVEFLRSEEGIKILGELR